MDKSHALTANLTMISLGTLVLVKCEEVKKLPPQLLMTALRSLLEVRITSMPPGKLGFRALSRCNLYPSRLLHVRNWSKFHFLRIGVSSSFFSHHLYHYLELFGLIYVKHQAGA